MIKFDEKYNYLREDWNYNRKQALLYWFNSWFNSKALNDNPTLSSELIQHWGGLDLFDWQRGGATNGRLYHDKYPFSWYISPVRERDSCKFVTLHSLNPHVHPEAEFAVSKINSSNVFMQQYGTFECRCTLPRGEGLFPAFWLWGTLERDGLKYYFEIDVFEIVSKKWRRHNNRLKINLHWNVKDMDGNIVVPKSKLLSHKVRIRHLDKFHHFKLDWRHDEIRIDYDGFNVFRFRNLEVLAFFNEPDMKAWMVLNNGVKKEYVPQPYKDQYSSFTVDYVRVTK